nr:hypothetical protein [Tanacetum cinerariifolium]
MLLVARSIKSTDMQHQPPLRCHPYRRQPPLFWRHLTTSVRRQPSVSPPLHPAAAGHFSSRCHPTKAAAATTYSTTSPPTPPSKHQDLSPPAAAATPPRQPLPPLITTTSSTQLTTPPSPNHRSHHDSRGITAVC